MCDWSSVLWTLGILAAIEALTLLVWPKWCLDLCKKCAKWKPNKFRNIAWIELLIAIVLIIIAYFV